MMFLYLSTRICLTIMPFSFSTRIPDDDVLVLEYPNIPDDDILVLEGPHVEAEDDLGPVGVHPCQPVAVLAHTHTHKLNIIPTSLTHNFMCENDM